MQEKIVLSFKKYTPQKFRIILRDINRYTWYHLQSFGQFKFAKVYFCPVNDKRYRTFIKKGQLLLSRYLGARERHRFIWHYLKYETELFTKKEIQLLHISPEFCFYEKLKNQTNITYFPVDKFEPGYDYQNLTRNFDLLDENLKAEQYDFIICNHVLEHITDDKTAIKNLYKILKFGGTAIISVPILADNKPTYEDNSITTPKERKKHFGQWDHVRYYGTDISERFQEAGFEVNPINSFVYFKESERVKFGVPTESWLFHLTKPPK